MKLAGHSGQPNWVAFSTDSKLLASGDRQGTVKLSGKYPRFRIYAEAEKGHMDRLLPMTPDFAQWLLATPKSERNGFVFHLGGNPTKQLSAKRVSRLASEIGRKAGIKVNVDNRGTVEVVKFASVHDLAGHLEPDGRRRSSRRR